jgi:hypothetical protein
VHRLDAEAREATEDEKRILVKYVGWGGIPHILAQSCAPANLAIAQSGRELLWPLHQLYLSRRSSVSHGVPFPSSALDHELFVIVQRYRYDRI